AGAASGSIALMTGRACAATAAPPIAGARVPLHAHRSAAAAASSAAAPRGNGACHLRNRGRDRAGGIRGAAAASVTVTPGCAMVERDSSRELERKGEDLSRKGKPERVGRPYDTDRDLVEEGEGKRSGTNLDLGEERSEEQQREMERWR